MYRYLELAPNVVYFSISSLKVGMLGRASFEVSSDVNLLFVIQHELE